ncbi:GNAT family N-acetyltransferase [Henriciella mobilis]|uniref:GNAT family N-acetyltransferase n=1 Tax=Henriciella mobilis TaxID=2305467 RepID=A0A399R566_9PROT|nr:GNAT family N-acetyltransferase [Henriciella mobilis]RIJ14798.1 GNAT family N-acetyltransferase [Henriciella mobilis]RIJ21754.1 GNAT family N-acetyltransferase [Henriciella mobilis]RIJ26746.1 GNAT family N-acetyltransferase [Henriciella mobilis]
MSVVIDLANLDAEDFRSLIQAHKALMLETTPPESSHALLIDGLKAPGITVWDMRENGMLIGCGALKRLSDGRSGEIKAMHTVAQFRKGGLGRRMLNHLLAEARSRYYARVYLETGSQDAFYPARKLYESAGFAYCGPFEGYRDDPNSVFMVYTFA